ncbi:hypothetical protein AAC387_Pa11g2070 [Persea americana]
MNFSSASSAHVRKYICPLLRQSTYAVALDIEGFKDCVSQQSPIPDDHHDDGEEAHMAEVTYAADTVAVDVEGCEDCVGYISSSISDDDEEETHLSV